MKVSQDYAASEVVRNPASGPIAEAAQHISWVPYYMICGTPHIMYTLRQFMRMNSVKPEQIQQFVLACSGHPLSVREIEGLAHGFFRGPESFRQQILSGNLALPLKQLKEVPSDPEGCSEFERLMLRDLELAQQYMQRVMAKSQDERLASRNFHAQCHLLANGILCRSTAFFQTLRKLHDRSGQA